MHNGGCAILEVPCAVHMEIGALRAKIIMRLRAKIYSLELRQKNTLNLYCHGNKNYHQRILASAVYCGMWGGNMSMNACGRKDNGRCKE